MSIQTMAEKAFDYIVHAFKIIDVLHHEIHEGHAFQFSVKVPDGSPIADNANLDLILITGSRYCHIQFDGAVGGESEASFYQDATYTGGVNVPIWNMNHNEDYFITSAVALQGITVTNVGTRRFISMIPGGTKNFATGSEAGNREEWILKPHTTYLARMTNRSGGTIYASMKATWYETETLTT